MRVRVRVRGVCEPRGEGGKHKLGFGGWLNFFFFFCGGCEGRGGEGSGDDGWGRGRVVRL